MEHIKDFEKKNCLTNTNGDTIKQYRIPDYDSIILQIDFTKSCVNSMATGRS